MFVNNTNNKRKHDLIETYSNTTNVNKNETQALFTKQRILNSILVVTGYQHSSFDEAFEIPILTVLDPKNGKLNFENFELKWCLGPRKISQQVRLFEFNHDLRFTCKWLKN